MIAVVCFSFVSSSKVLRIVGGGKRGRPASSARSSIPNIIGIVPILESDPPCVANVLRLNDINLDEFVRTLPDNLLAQFEAAGFKYKNTPTNDAAVKAYGDLTEWLIALKATRSV